MNKLTHVEIDEISILSKDVRPAVPGALVRIAKSDTPPVSILKTTAETTLERRAAEIQKAENISYHEGYAKALKEAPGLYTLYLAEVAKRDPKDIAAALAEEEARRKPTPLSKAEEEQELELMARKRAAQTGESFSKAYTNVLQTDEGRRLYKALTMSVGA